MSKIATHEQRTRIEQIIIECKIWGIGSVNIQKRLKDEVGIELSRPTIDQYAKTRLHGDLISRLVERVRNDEQPQTDAPSFDDSARTQALQSFATTA